MSFIIYLLVAFGCLAFLTLLTKYNNQGGRWISDSFQFHALAIYSLIPILQWFALITIVYYLALSKLEDKIIETLSLMHLIDNYLSKKN